MEQFMQKYDEKIKGVLSGFDRLVLRGSIRALSYVAGMMGFLSQMSVLLKDFGAYAQETTNSLKEASYEAARRLERPIKYLESSQIRKDNVARQIAQTDRITEGLICLLTSVEVCMGYDVSRNRREKQLQLVPRTRKCLHIYHYWIDPVFGFMSARIQNPVHEQIIGRNPFDYYWSVHQSEWATDIMFESAAALDRIYPSLVWSAMSSFSSPDVMRFLGKKLQRYLDALASLSSDRPLRELIEPACRRLKWKGKHIRGLRPWSQEDSSLLQVISRGEFMLNGFRNRDILTHLGPRRLLSPKEKRCLGARVTRQIRMLRAHSLIRKAPRSYRYIITAKGREIITAILKSQHITLEQLTKNAA